LRETLGEHDITAGRGLAPFGKRPDEPGVDRRRNRLIQGIAVAAMVLSVVWYMGLQFVVDAQAADLLMTLGRAYRDLLSGPSESDAGARG